MKDVSQRTWASRVEYWNHQSPAYRTQIAEACRRDGHEWARSPVCVVCMRCLKVNLAASEVIAA